MKNYYEVLGIPKYASISEVNKAFDKKNIDFSEIDNPSDTQKQAFEKIQAAYYTLSSEVSKKNYDNELSAITSAVPTSTASNDLAEEFLNISNKSSKKTSNTSVFAAILIISTLGSGYYYFQQKSDNAPLIAPTDSSITAPKKTAPTPPAQANLQPVFLQKFNEESLARPSAQLERGIVGDNNIQGSVEYPQEYFSQQILVTPNGSDFPSENGLLSDFPVYNYGDVKIKIINPTTEDAFVKIIFNDDGENFVIRHLFIKANTNLVVTGLPEGNVQLATLFPKYPQVSFLRFQEKIYLEAENILTIHGKKTSSAELF